ncbi:monofunctional biosynthetic peptidoglycan transglycosylase [Perlucidibaca piscinae]|uniref:monofunctional biosynthetic peptidoglycan transglycosylase n=1 Tax=Perlucidibaca piscinae TaxID=392589 RepID=UPI0003B6B2F7|nr:monofunctional biosynthetic peptidoglycan transglycosylase [Perlucidibaca piscinae]
MSFARLLWRITLLCAGLLLALQLWYLAHVLWWIKFDPVETAFMAARLDVLQEEDPDATLKQRWVPYEKISRHLKRSVMAAEDSLFMQHNGFDWEGIQYAFERNLKKGRLVAGGSTISQQLAKNLFLNGRRTPWRKAQEAAITVMLEQTMSKRRIFEIYLNVIEWGDGVYGAEAAARHHFGVSAANLSPRQAARLAAMIPRPRFYDERGSTRYLERRTGTILKRMRLVQPPR